MTKFILLNDLHLSDRTEETVFSILSYVASKAKETGAFVAILGDFYDTVYKSGQIDARLQQRTYNFFDSHFAPDTLYLLPGNHDMYNGYPENALTVFSSVATVYDTPTIDKHNILWLPYRDGGYTGSMVKKWKREGANICFTHNDFKYVSTRKNHISRDGMDPAIFDGIQVYNGHYHYPNEGQNVICMGSQYAIHKTETFDQKRLYTIDVRDDTFYDSYENIRFGRREFVYHMDYAKDLYEDYWCPYLRDKKDGEVPPPTFPTIQDTLVVECQDVMAYDDVPEENYFPKLDCPVIFRKAPEHEETKLESKEITMDTNIYDNVKHAVKDLYEFAPDLISCSLEDIEGYIIREFRSFEGVNIPMIVEKNPTKLTFEKISISNFCCFKGTTDITYDSATTKVTGPNGCGKTVQYSTALLYCVSGNMDDRFSEEKLLLSDVRAKDTNKSSVTVSGFVNDESFSIKREYNGKKTTLVFKVDGDEVKFPTSKRTQKEICEYLFNIYIPDGTCPNRFTHKTMLQRIVWKQGGRDSDFLKMSKDAFQTFLLETLDQGKYVAFIKHMKKKVLEQKKKLPVVKDKLDYYKILAEERKEVSTHENIMLKAWTEHRRRALTECRNKLSALESNTVEKTDVDNYIKHEVEKHTLQNQVKYLLESREGTRWSPEFTLTKLEEIVEETKLYQDQLDALNATVRMYVRCVETFKHIQKILFRRACDIMKRYSNVNFLPTKTKQLTNGQPMKYLSGGEYEKESLQLYKDFHLFLQKYLLWECNVTIYDEPGTAMNTQSLQTFTDGLKKDRCSIIITHKPIKCPLEVFLS